VLRSPYNQRKPDRENLPKHQENSTGSWLVPSGENSGPGKLAAGQIFDSIGSQCSSEKQGAYYFVRADSSSKKGADMAIIAYPGLF
jgi:hypothetical protein